MNLVFTRAGGVWADGTDLLAAELADIDLKTVTAVSGTGGSYFFETDMVWTGDGSTTFDVGVETVFRADITCENDIFLTGPVYVYGQSGFYADAYFLQETTFEGDLTANNDIFLIGGAYVYGGIGFYSGAFFEAGSDPEFNAPTTFNQPAEFNSSVIVNSTLITNGVTILGDASHIVSLRGPTTLQKTLSMTDAGSIAHRVVAGDDTTTSFSPLAVHEVILDEGVLSGSTDWYIDDTGCIDGNEILFANKDGAAEVVIRRPGGAPVTSLTGDWARCVRVGGVWKLAQKGSF